MEWTMEWNVEWIIELIMDGSLPHVSCLPCTQYTGVVINTVYPPDFDCWPTLITRIIQEPL